MRFVNWHQRGWDKTHVIGLIALKFYTQSAGNRKSSWEEGLKEVADWVSQFEDELNVSNMDYVMREGDALVADDLVLTSPERCRYYRRLILDISQSVTALHAAPAFSCLEMLDLRFMFCLILYSSTENREFILSKGHGAVGLYAVMEHKGVLSRLFLDGYCKPDGILGAHPDRGLPGIIASTGSLGHGIGLATGLAYSQKLSGGGSTCVLVSDGELQEGSSWEAIMMAANLLDNLLILVDFNDFGGMDRMS